LLRAFLLRFAFCMGGRPGGRVACRMHMQYATQYKRKQGAFCAAFLKIKNEAKRSKKNSTAVLGLVVS